MLSGSASLTSKRLLSLIAVLWFGMLCGFGAIAGCHAADKDSDTPSPDEETRQGFLVNVELPLVGERDQQVKNQISRIVDLTKGDRQRAVIVLKFFASPIADMLGDSQNGGLGTRGSQFERCLSLASYLTSPETRTARLIAYLPETVEGHAVLPVVSCEEIYCAPDAELGRAGIDDMSDPNLIKVAYQSAVGRRSTLPSAVVAAMLDPSEEVYLLNLGDSEYLVANQAEKKKLQDEGKLQGIESTLWPGGGLATFSGEEMRRQRWIADDVASETELVASLGLSGSLRTTRQLPRTWKAVAVTIAQDVTTAKINQMIRGLDAEIAEKDLNLVVFQFRQGTCDFSEAARLAQYVTRLENDEVYTIGVVQESLLGSLGLVATACQETVLIGGAELGAPAPREAAELDEATRRVLVDLADAAERPVSLLSVLINPEVRIVQYKNSVTQKRRLLADWEHSALPDKDQWLLDRQLLQGESIPAELAIKQRLVDGQADTTSIALSRLGVEETPRELKPSWLDASIQGVLAQSWLPRLLLTIGFFALMAELGSPGMGAGGFLAAVCFTGFFWVEGLNGNVEWLEILLFVGGLVALAIEIFVVPGFGVFGIGGLLMLFVSVVLASQTFIWPTNSTQLNEVSVNLFWTAMLGLGGMVGLLVMHKHLERLPMFRWFSVMPEEDPEDLDYRESIAHRDHLLHHEGLTTTRLNPSGKAQFGETIVPVVGTGAMIDEGVPVRVVEVRGNLVLVEESPR